MLLLLLQLAFAAPHPVGEPLDDVVGVQLSESGLGALTGSITSAVPVDPVPLDPLADDAGVGCVNYAYELTDAVAFVEVQDVQLVPRTNRLEVQVDLTVALNSPDDRFTLVTELFCAEQTCPGFVDPFPVRAVAPVSLEVISRGLEGRRIAVTVGDPVLDANLRSQDVTLDCNLGTVERVLDAVGLSLVELIADLAERQLASELSEQLEEIEVTIEQALEALVTDQVVDVAGTPVRVWTEPSSVDVQTTGLGLGLMLGAHTDALDPCVQQHQVDAFQAVASPLPSVSGIGSADARVLLGDGAIHPLLHAAWRGGLLCQSFDEGADLGISLDTSLLGLLGGEPFAELFPETRPLSIHTDPRQAPQVAFTDGAAVILVDELGVDLYAELDGRVARAVGLTVQAQIPAQIALDEGQLSLGIAIDEDALSVVATSNELAPQTSERLESGLGDLLVTALRGALGDVLGDLSFAVPSFEGVGLTELTVRGEGDQGEWGVLDAGVGPVEASSGEGCDGEGCASAAGLGGAAWWLLPWILRRRRRARDGRIGRAGRSA